MCYSIINNHPFMDGNKRVGFEGMRLMLRLNGYDVKASNKVKSEDEPLVSLFIRSFHDFFR